MEYGKLVKRAFRITWRYKVLWAFGVLAALFGGQAGGRFGNNLRYGVNQTDMQNWGSRWQRFFSEGRWDRFSMPYDLMPNLQRMGGWLVAGLAVIAAIALVVGILGILVRYTSLGALIGLVDDVEKAQTISFKAGFKRGWGRLLRLFAIDLLLALAALAGVLVVLLAGAIGGFVAAGPLLLAGAHNGVLTALGIVWAVLLGLVVALIFIAAMVALGGLVTVVREYAYRACILELNRVGPSIRAGLALVRSRFRESLITWLMLVGINLALGIVAIPLSLLGVGGVLLPPMAMMGLTESAPAAVATAIPLLLLVAAVSVFLGGLYLVFQSSVWTLAYREITAPAAEPLPQVIATEQ